MIKEYLKDMNMESETPHIVALCVSMVEINNLDLEELSACVKTMEGIERHVHRKLQQQMR